jgi:hypothetical protein
VIYLGSVNDSHAVQSLTWQEAKAFIAPLSFENARFEEMRRIIDAESGATGSSRV